MKPKSYALSPKALILDADGKCLLIQRSAGSKFWPSLWDLPGGKLDPGETFEQALLRECREETGLHVQLTGFVGATAWELPHINVLFVVMAAAVDGGAMVLSEEHDTHRWVTRAELATLPLVDPIAAVLHRSFEDRATSP